MNSPSGFATSEQDFAGMRRSVAAALNVDLRLPEWPFVASGFATIYEYDRVLGGTFGSVLEALASHYDDEDVTVVGLLPEMSYYRDWYGFLPAFRVDRPSIRDGYGAAMRWTPREYATGALIDVLDVIAITGSSGRWAVWGQRDWEIGLLLTQDDQGPWLEAAVPWFDHDLDLADIRSPPGWGMPLTEADLSSFWRQMRERGSGGGRR